MSEFPAQTLYRKQLAEQLARASRGSSPIEEDPARAAAAIAEAEVATGPESSKSADPELTATTEESAPPPDPTDASAAAQAKDAKDKNLGRKADKNSSAGAA